MGKETSSKFKIFVCFSLSGGSNKGDNYACEMKAVSAVADVKGREDGETYQFMAKCFPMNAARVKFLKQVS